MHTAPTEINAQPSHCGGSIVFRGTVELGNSDAVVPVLAEAACAAKKRVALSLSVIDSISRNWTPKSTRNTPVMKNWLRLNSTVRKPLWLVHQIRLERQKSPRQT